MGAELLCSLELLERLLALNLERSSATESVPMVEVTA